MPSALATRIAESPRAHAGRDDCRDQRDVRRARRADKRRHAENRIVSRQHHARAMQRDVRIVQASQRGSQAIRGQNCDRKEENNGREDRKAFGQIP